MRGTPGRRPTSVAQDNGPSLKPPGQRDTLTARALRAMAAEQRVAELETELSAVREELANRDNAILSLEKSLDLNAAESVRLANELIESAAALERMREQLERTRCALSTAKAERKEAVEHRHAETTELTAQLEAALERAASAEDKLAEAQQNILVMNFHNSAGEKRTESLENSLHAKDRDLQDLRRSHASLADEVMRLSDEKIKLSDERARLTNEVAKLAGEIDMREAALAHAEDRIALLAKLFMQLEAKADRGGQKEIGGIVRAGHLDALGRIGVGVAPNGKSGKSEKPGKPGKPGTPGECAVLKRDLDSDDWLFGGSKAARLS